MCGEACSVCGFIGWKRILIGCVYTNGDHDTILLSASVYVCTSMYILLVCV